MVIIIDIGHPAHVHLFRNFTQRMLTKGHFVHLTSRSKEFEIELLKTYNLPYITIGRHYRSKFGKVLGLIIYIIKMLRMINKIKPDLLLSHGSPYAAISAWIRSLPHISLEDTFNFEQVRLYSPFTTAILTGDYIHPIINERNIHYSGYHELAYLHPHVFKPDIAVLRELDVNPFDKFVIIRFVSWKATHDIGHKGMTLENKYKLIKNLLPIAKVFISSELELPPDLQKYEFPLAPSKMHNAMAFATLVFSESGTMASESAVLGVPSVFIDNTGRYYTKELEEKYQLVYNFTESESDQKRAMDLAIDIVKNPSIKEHYKFLRKKMLSEKIDVTAFLVWFIEDYPNSYEIMKVNPDFQNKFKK